MIKFKNITIGNSAGVLLALYFTLSALIPYGCKQEFAGFADQGVIIYDVEISDDNTDIPGAMMPSELKTYYLSGKTATSITAGLGLVETRIISDPVLRQYKTLVSAMGQKIALVLDEAKVSNNLNDRIDLELTYTGREKQIAGFTCKEVVVKDSTDNVFSIYFANDFPVKNVNWGTPFRDIDGLLMEYSMKFGNAVMSLRVKEVIMEKVDPALFEIPDDYQQIEDPAEMDMFM